MADTTISEVTQELQARKDKIAGSGPKADKQAAKEKAKLDQDVKAVGIDAIRVEIKRKKAERDLRRKKRLEAETAHNTAVNAAAAAN
ncbi:MAG: hypothetical protein GY829_08610 [Gammaproteobacteria bacterium]|nr:hypothetical protein [Gammaproteobacteria bacterium]